MGANLPPESGIRVPAGELRSLVGKLFGAVGMSAADADVMAELLVATDLRGVFSHGTRQTAGYVRMLQEGRVNARPNIDAVSTTTTTRMYDGDGGMGHLPCRMAAEFVAQTAVELGVGAATTGNHFHFGAAGKYSRLAAERDCIGLAVSSHRYPRQGSIRGATGGSPISIAVPAGQQAPLVIDMGTGLLPWDEDLFEKLGAFPWFKQLGLGAVAHALGGVLAGIWRTDRIPPASPWEANQGGFFAAFQIQALCPLDEFRAEMDRYVAECEKLEPFPGQPRAVLPGGLEWRHEREWAATGVPMSDEHVQSLRELADELHLDTPFERFANTRFNGPLD